MCPKEAFTPASASIMGMPLDSHGLLYEDCDPKDEISRGIISAFLLEKLVFELHKEVQH